MKAATTGFKCVIFDLGGVVFSSPIVRLGKLERVRGIQHNLLNRYIARCNAWKKLEKGMITPSEFIESHYDEELKRNIEAQGSVVDSSLLDVTGKEIMDSIMSPEAWIPRKPYVEAITVLRSSGFTTCALTNNFKGEDFDVMESTVTEIFDFVVESSKVNMRKPSFEIYDYTCSKAQSHPSQCVFLDDIGANLKAARDMGIHTIRVSGDDEEGVQALLELEEVVKLSPIFSSFRP
jgi:epoxide hydrolase-like predicted phosphatase